MKLNPAQQLIEFGQSVWYDNISRELLDSGEIKRLIDEWGVRGMTSNPTIFDNAISKSTVYDRTITELRKKGLDEVGIFDELALEDIGRAADLLRPIYDSSNGDDGFVSIEVSPLLARDTEKTVVEGVRLFKRLNRPNIMVKVPGTDEGIPAVRRLLVEGVNVNITLLFSAENYVAVAKTYVEALQERAKKGLDVSKIRSVASFFVSRVDTVVDKELSKIAESGDAARAEEAKALIGKFGIANSKVAYLRFRQIFGSPEFRELEKKGAKAQRPLWASTGTKNPAYRDVLYVEELIGPDTVNTMPHDTLKAFVDHGRVRESLQEGLEESPSVEARLQKLGVDTAAALRELQIDGVKKFVDSFHALNQAIAKKL